MTTAVRGTGAIPAITAVVDGVAAIGLADDELERFLRREGIRKVSARDLAVAVALRESGATTVAATLAIIARSDVQVFATGGIGGVHRAPAFDESADLIELSRTPRVVVCAGAKSILDLPATVERLETLGIPVIGFGTDEFPAFFSSGSGLPVSATVETVEQVALVERAHRRLGRSEALLVVQPPPPGSALPLEEIERAVAIALSEAESSGVRGSAMTPFLLASVERATERRSLAANLALLESNAELAGRIAVALSTLSG
jgi:pseudouridine-5'-phosphate glycosidase